MVLGQEEGTTRKAGRHTTLRTFGWARKRLKGVRAIHGEVLKCRLQSEEEPALGSWRLSTLCVFTSDLYTVLPGRPPSSKSGN